MLKLKLKFLCLIILNFTKLLTAQQLDDDPTGYFAPNSLHLNYTQQINFSQYVAYSMRSLALVAGYDNDLHRYDDKQHLVDSFARPEVAEYLGVAPRADSSEFHLMHDQSDSTLVQNELNQVECARQVDLMYEQTLALRKNYSTYAHSRQLDLIDWLDSWGAAPSDQLLMGNNQWLGSYEQCQRASFKLGQSEHLRGRYCLAGLQLPEWQQQQQQQLQQQQQQQQQQQLNGSSPARAQIKLAVCLPRACNSISLLRHSNRLEALIKLVRLQQVPYSSAHLATLFCLPDEDSPLRQYSWSARLFLGFVTSWLALIVYVSLKLEWAYTRRQLMSEQQLPASRHSKLIQIFAFRHAWQKLFGTQRVRSPEPEVSMAQPVNLSGAKTIVTVTMKTGSEEAATGSGEAAAAAAGSKTDQLAMVDGLKVISMIWLVSAHTMLFFIRNITNGRDFWALVLDARFLTIMAGIFPVDSFFTITGVLTAYLKFTETSKARLTSAHPQKSFTRLSYWLEMFVHRYLRFMPMYLLVFWFTRDVSEYLGTGPMWDYATSSGSLRSMCKRESVLVPMLFQANFKPIDQHCVKPAWYLANDYQYLLITPLFMLLLLASRWLGYLAIVASVIGSLVMQFLTVYYPPLNANSSQPFSDFAGLVNFRPMFAAYVLKDLWRLYVLPYNRIPPYLIGLLTGHLMFRFHTQRNCSSAHATSAPTDSSLTLRSASSSSSSSGVSSDSDSEMETTTTTTAEPRKQVRQKTSTPTKIKSISGLRVLGALLSEHINLNIWLPISLLLSVIYLPLASKLLEPQEGERARIGASLIIALMRFVWSLSIARLIYVCFVATNQQQQQQQLAKHQNGSLIIDFLSSPIWKPWSKIGLSVLLIQWEIIGYVAQIQTTQPFMSISFLIAVVLVCIISSYVLGLIVYLTFEFPLSQIELLYIRPKLFKRRTN